MVGTQCLAFYSLNYIQHTWWYCLINRFIQRNFAIFLCTSLAGVFHVQRFQVLEQSMDVTLAMVKQSCGTHYVPHAMMSGLMPTRSTLITVFLNFCQLKQN
jgi:uncharacterized membrane protein YbjE (DUF340 family)